MFALVDCNNFYASCERAFRPDLIGKPIAILSNNDGCIIARSSEAKALNIPMGGPYFKCKDDLKKHGVTVFSSNYPLYGDMSNRVMNILSSLAPEIEVYSIDEAFLKFKDCDYLDFYTHANIILNEVVKSTGIPISIGFAPTKALAKVANKIAKKYASKTNNIHIIDSEEKRIKALKWCKIEDVWGIGRGHIKRLKALNVNNAYEFTQLSDELVKKRMAIVGLRLKKDLEGKPTLDLDQYTEKRNIATTRSFEKDYITYEEVRERITTFTISCAEKLRKQKSQCQCISVFISSNRHKKEEGEYKNGSTIQLPFSTNSSIDLVKFAIHGLDKIFIQGYRYKRAGVIVSQLSPSNQQQLVLFQQKNQRHEKLMEVMDKVNKNTSEHTIKLASQDLERTWKMNQNYLSPRYTTRLSEVIQINA